MATHQNPSIPGTSSLPSPEAVGDRLSEAASSAASYVKDTAVSAREQAEELGRAATRRFSATADYVEQRGVEGMVTDVEAMVRRNPGPALLAAAVVGFLFARTLSRD